MKIKIDNGYLEYEVNGSGAPILFIHGYPLSRKIWEPQIDGLSDLATVITVDLRGHGESFPFEGPYSMDLLADDCKKLLDELEFKKATVCGLSMGGYITFAMYRKFPHLFSGMILTSTRPGPDSPEGKANRDSSIKNALEFHAGFISDQMIQKIVSPTTLSSKPELITEIRNIMSNTSIQGIVGALQGMRDRLDSTPLLPDITCPVLIIRGDDDQLISIQDAEMMNQLIPDSRFIKLTNAGHMVNLEMPDQYNHAIRNFLLSLS